MNLQVSMTLPKGVRTFTCHMQAGECASAYRNLQELHSCVTNAGPQLLLGRETSSSRVPNQVFSPLLQEWITSISLKPGRIPEILVNDNPDLIILRLSYVWSSCQNYSQPLKRQ
jgi:hypothetical protein